MASKTRYGEQSMATAPRTRIRRVSLISGHDPLQHAARVRRGMTASEFYRIMERGPLALAEWSHALDLSLRTLQRFKGSREKLGRTYADRVLRLSMLMERGREVFGEKEKFHRWFERPNITLGGVPPKELIDTSFGIALVEDELGRIEHGIFA